MQNSGITYDEGGFIVSQRIEKKVKDIDHGVTEILKLLGAEVKASLDAIKATPLEVALNPRQARDFGQLIKEAAKKNSSKSAHNRSSEQHQQKPSTSSRTNTRQNRSNDASERTQNNNAQSKQASHTEPNKSRDENGRFVAGQVSTIGKIEDLVKSLGRNGFGGVDSQGVDPTLDAMREVGSMLSPVKQIAGTFFRPLTGLAKLKKRAEPIPKEEADHNRKQLRVLQFISDNISKLKQNSLFNRGLGGLGGLLKKGRGLPLIGGLLGLLSLSTWNQQSTQEKGGTVGAIGGGAIGGVLGSVLGPVGTVVGAGVGAWIGDKLGEEVAPYFEKWVSKLELANIPKQLIDEWKEFVSHLWTSFKNSIPQPLRDTANNVGNWIEDKVEALKDAVTGGNSVSPEGTTTSKRNRVAIKRVLEVGPGYNKVELHDGSIVKQTGSWNHRNNNPGNIEYSEKKGSIAQRFGALKPERVVNGKTEGDRFSVFPTYEAGRNAKSYLIFESNNAKNLRTEADYGAGLGYKDKTLMQMIASYAPPEDNNDTRAYQRAVLAAVGNKNKRMREYTQAEREAILNAMEKKEGSYNVKRTVLSPAKIAQDAKKPLAQTPKGADALADFAQQSQIPFKSSVAPSFQVPSVSTIKQQPVTPFKLPQVQQTQTKLSASAKPPIVTGHNSNDTISQDVSDRSLAHAITGGIGRTTWNNV